MNDKPLKNEEVDDYTVIESTEDGDALPQKDALKKLREDLKICRSEKEEYLTGWQRSKADYVNLQRDEESKRKELRSMITSAFVEDLLPVLDSFDMAFSNKESWEKVDENWRKGVEYIYSRLLQALNDNTVTPIDTINITFDPLIHESIETIATDDQTKDHMISKVIQKGFKIGEKVIRPARVIIYEYKA